MRPWGPGLSARKTPLTGRGALLGSGRLQTGGQAQVRCGDAFLCLQVSRGPWQVLCRSCPRAEPGMRVPLSHQGCRTEGPRGHATLPLHTSVSLPGGK